MKAVTAQRQRVPKNRLIASAPRATNADGSSPWWVTQPIACSGVCSSATMTGSASCASPGCAASNKRSEMGSDNLHCRTGSAGRAVVLPDWGDRA